PLNERLANAQLVVEGVVESERSVWDNNHQLIYTLYTIKPTTLFKGSVTGHIAIVSKGGQVGNQRLLVTNQVELHTGQAGLFTLIPNTHALSSNLPLYECYAAVQGLIRYDPVNHSAAAVFDRYASVENNMYPLLERQLGRSKTIITPLNWNKLNGAPQTGSNAMANNGSPNGTEAIMAITGFTPTSIAAGSKEILTINGSGFGSTQGTSYVQFKYADDGGGTWTAPASGEYLSWSDTQIQLYVPTKAGTGQIRVVTGSTATSTGTLTVTYNLTNVTGYNSTAYFPTLINDDGSGGYTFTFSTDITTNANTYFTKALADWVCNSDISWGISSSTTTIDAVANDNVNVVRFGTLSTGVLGETSVWLGSCSSSSSWVVPEVDMTFSSSSSFYYGTGTPGGSQYDFYTIALHELGHAHLLGHVINSGTMMHYAISAGATARTFNATQETAGAADVITQCLAGANCFQSTITGSTATACTQPTVTLTTGAASISENGGSTTVTATLSAKYIAPVTVTLSTSGTATSGTDYTALTTTITIPAGSTTGSVTLTATDDAAYEGNETVIVSISSVTNGTENGTQQQTVTITDNESAPAVSISSSFSISTEGGSGLTITATQSTTSSLATTVNFSFSGTAVYGTDYTMNSSITIPAGSTSATTSLVPTDDANDELTETIIIDVSSVTNGTENGTQQLTINLND
ncbi:MAG: IPT/TIG domain-containing protein, partial [Dinghuibacter sp.]|nr:IPT/TIG domain-containing protein [Dinghuibacter sp.]